MSDTPTREPMAGEMPEAVVYREWTQRALNSLRFLRQIARANGYAAAVHGSLMRDLDVVCVPWTEEAVSPDDLVEKIAKMMSDEDCPVYVTKKLMADKPHGRLSTVLHFKNEPFSYIDLSVMPVAALPPARPAEPTSERKGFEQGFHDGREAVLRSLVTHFTPLGIKCNASANTGSSFVADLADEVRHALEDAAAPLPSGEPTGEAVPLAWAIFDRFGRTRADNMSNAKASSGNDVWIRERLANLEKMAQLAHDDNAPYTLRPLYAHPLASDAPSDRMDESTRQRAAAWGDVFSLLWDKSERFRAHCGTSQTACEAALEVIGNALTPASPPQDAPRLAEVATDKQFSGTWNNWIAPFHRCASCGDSLNWQQSVDVFDRPLITASCACGVMYSARLSEEGLEQGRAVDAGNKLAAEISDALTRTAEMNAAIDAFDQEARLLYYRDGDIYNEKAKEAARAHLLALSGVPANEAAVIEGDAEPITCWAGHAGVGTIRTIEQLAHDGTRDTTCTARSTTWKCCCAHCASWRASLTTLPRHSPPHPHLRTAR